MHPVRDFKRLVNNSFQVLVCFSVGIHVVVETKKITIGKKGRPDERK